MKNTRQVRTHGARSKRKHFRDLTPEDIAQLPTNATGKGPRDNEAVARFELMVENLRAMCESDTIPPYKLMDGMEEYCQELENLLHRDHLGKSSIARSIPQDEQERLKHYVDMFVISYGNSLIEYAACKLAELEVIFNNDKSMELTDELMLSSITRFFQRAGGKLQLGDSNISPAEWAKFVPDMTTLLCGSTLPRLAGRARSLHRSWTRVLPEVETISEGSFSDDVLMRADPMAKLSDNDNADLFDIGDGIAHFQSDSSITSESDNQQDHVPILHGRNWLSSYDYVHNPFPENRPFEIANSRLIDRDITMPGIHSDGLRVRDLVSIPPIHCRKPGTYNPLFKRRIPLGPYEVTKALLSWLGTSISRGNPNQVRPLPGVAIIPRDITRHKKHYRHGRSGVVKPSKKQVFRLLGGNPKADYDPDSIRPEDAPRPTTFNGEEPKTSSRSQLATRLESLRKPVVVADSNDDPISVRDTSFSAPLQHNDDKPKTSTLTREKKAVLGSRSKDLSSADNDSLDANGHSVISPPIPSNQADQPSSITKRNHQSNTVASDQTSVFRDSSSANVNNPPVPDTHPSLTSPHAGLTRSPSQRLPSPPRDPSRTGSVPPPSPPKHYPAGQRLPRAGLCHPCPIYFGHIHHICTQEECNLPSQNHISLAQIPDNSRGALPNNARPDFVLPTGSVVLRPDSTRASLQHRRYADLFWQRPGTHFQINNIWYQLRIGDHETLWIDRLEIPLGSRDNIGGLDSDNNRQDRPGDAQPQGDQGEPKELTKAEHDQLRDAAVQKFLSKFQQDVKRHERDQTTLEPLTYGNDIEDEARLLSVQISSLSSLVLAGFPNYFDNFYPGRDFQENLDAARLVLTRYRSLDRIWNSSDGAETRERLQQHTARLGFILRHIDNRSYPELTPGDYADEDVIVQTPYCNMTVRNRCQRLKRRLPRLSHLARVLERRGVRGLEADKKVIRRAEECLAQDRFLLLVRFLVRTGDIIRRWEREELETVYSGDRKAYVDEFDGYDEADRTKYFNSRHDLRRTLHDYRPMYVSMTGRYVQNRLKVLLWRFEAIESFTRLLPGNHFEVDASEVRQFEKALSLAGNAYHHASEYQFTMNTEKEVCGGNVGYVVGFEDAVLYLESCAAKCIDPEEWDEGYVKVFDGLCVQDWVLDWEELGDEIIGDLTNNHGALGMELRL